MNKLLFTLLFSIAFLTSFSQENIENVINVEEKKEALKKLSVEIKNSTAKNMERALKLAKEKGWIINKILPNGEVISLQGVDDGGLPIYYATDYNIRAAATIGTDKLWPNGLLGLNLSGSSSFMDGKLAIWDGGKVLSTHQELVGRIELEDNSPSLSDHSTHVAGTMIASGVNYLAKGMSFGANILKNWDYNNDQTEMSDNASTLLISNHSYGTIAGWRYNTDRTGTSSNPYWEWWGDVNISTYEDYNFGYYNSSAQAWDQIAYYAPYYLIVKSSGNNRSYTGPAIGSPYWRYNSSGQWELISSRENGSVSSNDTYDNISTYGTAKNILTVGAVNPIPNGYKKVDDVVLSDFSSCGPTDDGRIKPDVVANGVDLYSCISTGNAYYGMMSGTSMATPNTSGSIFLLQEHYHNLKGQFMLSSTLKGLICHSADEAGNPGPDYQYGWGLVDMGKAASIISNTDNSNDIEELSLSSGSTITKNVTASGNGKLIATICWTDPAATPIAYGTSMLNNKSPRLVNDLDIRVTDGTNTFMPWVLNVYVPGNYATHGDNTVDNIEQVVIDNPVPGKEYTITITHKNTLASSQVFSLIISGIGGNSMDASSALNSNDSRIDRVVFNTIDNNTASDCQTYRDYTSLNTILRKGAAYPITITTGTCGVENNRAIKVFIDWNSNGSFESDETAATSDIINTSGNFSANIQVPTTVKVGNFARMRIVLMETSDVNEILATGTYAKGETQDYLVKFDAPSVDLGITSFSLPNDNNLYTSDDQKIEINLENYGVSDVSNISFSAEILEDNVVIANLNETYNNTINALSDDVFRFNEGFATKPGSTYKITCVATVNDDSNLTNNTLEKEFTVPSLVEITDAQAIHCDGNSAINLSATGSGAIFWYDAATDGNLLAAGNTTKTTTIPTDNKYYAGLNNFSESIGPETKNSSPWTNGTYTQATAHPIITTYVPLIIKSAKLYIGWPGKINLWIENATTGAIISSTTFRVSTTRSTATSTIGAEDDPNDTGSEYQLNLAIPTPGTYGILISYEDGATLFRNNAQSSNPYPYSIPNVIKINTTNASTTPNSYYYWLYDMKIEGYGEKSALTEVAIQEKASPVVDLGNDFTADGSATLDAGNPGCSYLWNTSETTQTITVSHGGTYSVTVTNEWGCSASDNVTLTFTDINPEEILPISVFPNPTSKLFYVEADQNILVDVYNLNGIKVIQKNTPSVKHSIDVSNLAPSTYLVKVYYPNSNKYKLYKVVVK